MPACSPGLEATIYRVAENCLEMYTETECTVDDYELFTNGSAEICPARLKAEFAEMLTPNLPGRNHEF